MYEGIVTKMKAKLTADLVQYYFICGTQQVLANDWLGKKLKISHSALIYCTNCNRAIKKTYSTGYCYPCSMRLAACDICIVKPEKCHYHLGTCREPDWGLQHCMTDHLVYLANTSQLKIGITRKINIPTRWIDQGARYAIPIIQVKKRYHAGLVEKYLTQNFKDVTNWRKMLQGDPEYIDLDQVRHQIQNEHLPAIVELIGYEPEILSSTELTINYPVLEYPKKIVSHNLLKEPVIEATLQGIKGQYLIFDTGVLNIRNLEGYVLKVEIA